MYSAHRNSRPWHGAGLTGKKEFPEYDAQCYLCPRNLRVGGVVNPDYHDVFIFENDHPVVGMNAPEILNSGSPGNLYKKGKAGGVAKVVCYDPRHNISLAEMKLENVFTVFKSFRSEMVDFERNPLIKFVLLFENRGEAVGVSNPHPHCQIYATDFTFRFVEQQIDISDRYQEKSGRNIYSDIIENESRDGVRVIAENKTAIAFIPFFARYAYEVMIFPKANHTTLISFADDELLDLTSVFHQVIRKLDMNFDMSFPYVMSVMQAPLDGGNYKNFRMHLWLQPPYRQPGLSKFLAGPEIGGGNFMADTMPEEKAAELRKINVKNYLLER